MTPFITFLTPAFRRPQALASCLASVGSQSAVEAIEQIVLPDHVGLGIVEGLYGRLPRYADAVHGQYVHILADDDVLAGPHVVALVRQFAIQRGCPDVILVNAIKDLCGPVWLPANWDGVPVCGQIDMGCLIVRADVWRAHVQDYQTGRYEADFDHAAAMHRAGREFARLDLDFLRGAVMRGAPEAVRS